MSLFALVLAWLVEQVRPLRHGSWPNRVLRRWARWVARNVDTGKLVHARVGWVLIVGVPALACTLVHWGLQQLLGSFVAMLWDALLLYACLGWRSFSQHFMAIRNALADGDEELARRLLAAWQGVETARVPGTEIARHAIEYAVLSAHRHVFGVVAWYGFTAMLGLAPLGAVMYRLAEVTMRDARLRHTVLALSERSLLAEVAERAWQVLDWAPARLTALSLAVVGNFVEAVSSWRSHAQQAPMDSDGLLLTATAGALNIRLGGASLARLAPPGHASARDQAWSTADAIFTPQLTAQTGTPHRREPEVPRMGEVAKLLWRSLGVWLLMLVLLALARLL